MATSFDLTGAKKKKAKKIPGLADVDWGGVGSALQGIIPAAPAAPAAAAQAPANPNWWQDAIYNSIAGPGGTAETDLNNLRGFLTGGANRSFSDLGVTVAGDPLSGQATYSIADNVDVTNPFSRAALLKKSYMANSAATRDNQAARGQLRAGATQSRANSLATQNLQGQDTLTKQAGDIGQGVYGQLLSAQGQARDQMSQAASDAYARNQNTPVDPAYAAAVAPTAAAGLTPRRVAKVVGGVKYYLTASGKLAPIPKGAPIIG